MFLFMNIKSLLSIVLFSVFHRENILAFVTMSFRCFSITRMLFYVVNFFTPKVDSSHDGWEIWNLFRLLFLMVFFFFFSKYQKPDVYSIIACLCLSNASVNDVMKTCRCSLFFVCSNVKRWLNPCQPETWWHIWSLSDALTYYFFFKIMERVKEKICECCRKIPIELLRFLPSFIRWDESLWRC